MEGYRSAAWNKFLGDTVKKLLKDRIIAAEPDITAAVKIFMSDCLCRYAEMYTCFYFIENLVRERKILCLVRL